MLLNVVDSGGFTQKIVVAGQEAIVDKSGSIAVTGVAQNVSVANANRSGFFFQNIGANVMYLNDLGAATTSTFVVPVNGTFPPHGYPVSTGAWSVLGTVGDKFVAREW